MISGISCFWNALPASFFLKIKRCTKASETSVWSVWTKMITVVKVRCCPLDRLILPHPFSSRSKLLCECVTQQSDSRGRSSVGGLLHQVSLPWWPGRWLLGGKSSGYLLPPQKLHARRDVLTEKLTGSAQTEHTHTTTRTTSLSIANRTECKQDKLWNKIRNKIEMIIFSRWVQGLQE